MKVLVSCRLKKTQHIPNKPQSDKAGQASSVFRQKGELRGARKGDRNGYNGNSKKPSGGHPKVRKGIIPAGTEAV